LNDAVNRRVIGYNAAHGASKPNYIPEGMQILYESPVRHLLISAKGDRYEALYHLAIKIGMRQGEILGLKWSDVDWRKGYCEYSVNLNV